MIVYDREGNKHDKESVDAAECVNNLGWTLQAPVMAVSDNPAETAKTGSKKKGTAAAETLPAGE